MKFIKKHKVLFICLGVLIILFVIAFIGIKNIIYPDDSKSKYGDRLDGIENVKISDDAISKIKEEIGKNEGFSDVKYELTGKTVKIFVTVDDTVDITKSKSSSEAILSNLTDEQKAYYDIQYYVTCSGENELYPIIGSKHKTSEAFVWTIKSQGDTDAE